LHQCPGGGGRGRSAGVASWKGRDRGGRSIGEIGKRPEQRGDRETAVGPGADGHELKGVVLVDPADLDGGSRDTDITSSVHWRLTYLYLLLQDLKYSLVDHWLHMFLVYTSVDIIYCTLLATSCLRRPFFF
jgi:hypothetical protein